MEGSNCGKSRPKEIFGHSLFKKKPWLEDEFSLTPPEDSGFLSMRLNFENRRSKTINADTSVPQLKLSNEDVKHGSFHTSADHEPGLVQFQVVPSVSTTEDPQLKPKHQSVFSLSAPISSERRSSHDFQRRKDNQPSVLVEVPTKAEANVPKTVNINKGPYNLVAKLDKLFVKYPKASSTESQSESGSDLDEVPTKKISSSINLFFSQSAEHRSDHSSVSRSEAPDIALEDHSTSTANMGQEQNKLTNYFFTNSMFSGAAQSAVSDYVSRSGGMVSQVGSGYSAEPHMQTSVASNFSGAGTDAFDASGGQVKTPKKRPKPSTLREMNFWAPQSM